ncbi:MAG: hypothetical protein FWF82_00950 [Oscillospiraceae bacterium]|nr:hypothetical protein [Oscillospiraceae bacterium]
MNKLTVIYSLSTLPYYAKAKQEISPKDGLCSSDGRILTSKEPESLPGGFRLDRFELYTAALSSLTRRRDGNRTVMYCDSRGAEYFRKAGLLSLWDEVKTTIPDDLDGINPRMFWAAGKLYALNSTPCPLLMLDTDFIAWKLPEFDSDIVAAHREPLLQNIYPPVTTFRMKPDYIFDKRLNYSAEPLNTAFLYMDNDGFKQYYVHNAVRFMKSAESCGDYLTYMVFAEQRLLAILADNHKIKVGTVMEYGKQHAQKSYSHTWGAKQIMRNKPEQCERFCEKCRNRIRTDFPDWGFIIDLIK